MADVRTSEAGATLSQRIWRWRHISEKFAAFVVAVFVQNVKEQTGDHLHFLITLHLGGDK
jgi:hypothetical protein